MQLFIVNNPYWGFNINPNNKCARALGTPGESCHLCERHDNNLPGDWGDGSAGVTHDC